MRWLVTLTLIALASPAHADDGYFFQESGGPATFRGELGRYDATAMIQFGLTFGVDHGLSRRSAGSPFRDLGYTDCYGSECAYAAKPKASLGMFGIDLKKRVRLLYMSVHLNGQRHTYQRPGVFVSLHGGPRVIGGEDALANYHGYGIGGGATLEGDLWVLVTTSMSAPT